MKLTVMERLLTQSLIPREANYANLKLIREAREELSFSDAENKQLNFRVDKDRTEWNPVDIQKDIDLGETVTGMVVKELKRLDEANKLTAEQFSLYEKFVSDKE